MGILLIVASAPSRPPAEPEAAAGEAPACADQPEPEPAEGSRIANAGRGGECLGARKTGVESLGAPSEASRPAWSRDSVGIQRPACGLRDGVVETIARLESIWVVNCPVYFGVSLLSDLAQTSRSSKLEKADILEMTVRFLQEQPASLYSTTASGE